MIAALQVLLPHSVYCPKDSAFSVLTAKVDRYEIAILAPYQSAASWQDASLESEIPLTEIVKRLGKREPSVLSKSLRLSGAEAIECNAMQITFKAESFDRSVPAAGSEPKHDPPLDFAFGMLNGALMALRKVTGAFYLKPLDPHSTIWRLGYYNDDGSELAPEKGKLRAHLGTSFKFQVCGIDSMSWDNLTKLPVGYESPAWESLYNEALALLPDLGPSIVLTFSSIEVILSLVTDSLARGGFQPYSLWEWLNSRDQFWKEPSVADRADVILKGLSGQSLKAQQILWESFVRLRDYRNSYIHRGILEAKGRTLSSLEGIALVTAGKAILDWLEKCLPAEQQSLKFATEMQLEMMKRLT